MTAVFNRPGRPPRGYTLPPSTFDMVDPGFDDDDGQVVELVRRHGVVATHPDGNRLAFNPVPLHGDDERRRHERPKPPPLPATPAEIAAAIDIMAGVQAGKTAVPPFSDPSLRKLAVLFLLSFR